MAVEVAALGEVASGAARTGGWPRPWRSSTARWPTRRTARPATAQTAELTKPQRGLLARPKIPQPEKIIEASP
jgi:hypothetical protein